MAQQFLSGVKITAGDENTLYLDTGATGQQTTIFYQVNGSYKYQQRVGANWELYNYTTSNWDFHIGGTTGYLALGHNDPKARLHLSGDNSAKSAIRQSRTGTVIWDQAIDSSGRLQWGTRASEGGTRAVLFTLDDDGTVGVGVSPAQEKLHVYNAGTARIEIEGTSGPAAFKATNSQGSFGWYIPSDANEFRLWNFGTSADLIEVDASGNTTFTGNLTVNGDTQLGNALTDKVVIHGHLGIGHESYPKIAYPGQNALWGGSGTTTGQIVIDLPGTLGSYDMMYMEIDIYEYSSTAATKLIIGGHNWNSGGNSNTSTTQWYNVNVQVLGALDKPVYFGRRNDGTSERRCIAIGETTSTWSYATVHVHKVHGAEFYSTGIDWIADWNIAQTTSGTYFTKNPTTNFNSTSTTTFDTNGKISASGAAFTSNIDVGGTITMSSSGNIFSDSIFQFLTTGSAAQIGKFKSIQLSTSYSGTPPSQGILFGTDTNLYRDSSNILKTDDNLVVVGTIGSGQVTATVNSGTNFEARKGSGSGAVGFGGTAHQTGLIEGVDGGGLKLYTAGNDVNWGGAWALNTTWSGTGMTVAGTIGASNLSGTNTGDQDLSGYATTGSIPTDFVSAANGGTFSGNVNVFPNAGTGTFRVGRYSGQEFKLHSTDLTNTITSIQDLDENQAHDFILNREHAGSGANNFIIQKDGSNQLTIDKDGNVQISGDLTVGGANTILKTQTVEVEDNIIQLNTTQASPNTATAITSGISIYRGDGITQASFIFDDSDDTWDLTNNLKINATATSELALNVNDRIKALGNGTMSWGSSANFGNLTWDTGYALVGGLSGKGLKLFTNGGSGIALTLDTSQNATFSGSVTTPALTIDGTNSLIKYGANNDIDTTTVTISNIGKSDYTAVFFDYVIKKGTNVRAGVIYACHDGTNVEFNETSTVDLGDTSDVTLSVDISGTNMRLRATTTSNDWSVKSLIRAI